MAEKKSKEKKQEELAKKQGDALIASYNLHMEELVHTVKKKDDYIVTLAFGSSSGMYKMQSDKTLDWESPDAFGIMHMEVVIQDRDDRRFIPNLNVSVRMYDNEHGLVTESEAPFMKESGTEDLGPGYYQLLGAPHDQAAKAGQVCHSLVERLQRIIPYPAIPHEQGITRGQLEVGSD